MKAISHSTKRDSDEGCCRLASLPTWGTDAVLRRQTDPRVVEQAPSGPALGSETVTVWWDQADARCTPRSRSRRTVRGNPSGTRPGTVLGAQTRWGTLE